jgi:hypothetical protein
LAPNDDLAGRMRRGGIAQIDVLACPDCGGRLRLLATIEDPALAEILR